MKQVTYIALVAAFIFGVQPLEAISAEKNVVEMEKGGRGDATVSYDPETELLSVVMTTDGDLERAQVFVAHHGTVVTKETLVIDGRKTELEIDLEGNTSGVYSVKVVSDSIRLTKRFKKH